LFFIVSPLIFYCCCIKTLLQCNHPCLNLAPTLKRLFCTGYNKTRAPCSCCIHSQLRRLLYPVYIYHRATRARMAILYLFHSIIYTFLKPLFFVVYCCCNFCIKRNAQPL
jgi:hypothetical protein